MAPRNRVDASEEPHPRSAIGPRRILRRLFSRMHRRGWVDSRLYGPLPRSEVRALRVRTSLCLHRFGEPSVHRVAVHDCFSAHRRDRIAHGETQAWRSSTMDAPLCEGQIDPADRLDVLLSNRSVPRPKALEGWLNNFCYLSEWRR